MIFPSISIIEYKKGGIDFQDVKEIFNTIEEIYRELAQEDIKEKEIIVDVTGGQVPTSIGAAMATLSRGRQFQYVSTKDKSIILYDIGYFED